ncbi:unnamed protein product [Urochloa humidicola]
MLALSPARCADVEECTGGAGIMELEEIGPVSDLDFDFTVDDIDFGDFFLRLEDGDALPDLEVDPAEIFTDFEAIATTGSDGVMDQEVPSVQSLADAVHLDAVDPCSSVLREENNTACPDVEEGKGECNHVEEVVPAGNNCDLGGGGGGTILAEEKSPSSTTSSSQEAESRHKSSKHSQGKKKAKKYRSHRKHMLARETEAASWTQRRQMYAAGGAPAAVKRPDSNAWAVPTIGFPPPPPGPHPMQHFGRPLHVWGHPTPGVESPRVPMWPRHLVPRAPTPPWAPPPSDPAFWHHPYMRGPPHMPGQVAPCVAVPMPAARFPAPPVRGVLPCPPPMYRPLVPPALASKSQQDTQLQLQTQPSSESIDAAIGDVLSKPWLPLPLGLKPPSVDSVMGELQRQGVADVPPACS